ncbi:hypothetical protein EV426DRAFT_666012 [Tirmania nivea]|nr:hypothetical protein EV426DRAFT_666012 [Tirmania nivea]
MHKYYLILNGWVADWPEQCTVALVKQNRYPVCKASTEEFGNPKPPNGWRDRDPAAYMSNDELAATHRYHKNSPSSTPLPERQRMVKQRRTTDGILPTVNEFEEYSSCSPYSLWRFDWLNVCILAPLLKPTNERRHPEVVILAQQRYHTETSLSSIDNTLAKFHNLKDVFLPARERPNFNFPKMHLLSHLMDHIRQHRSYDSWTTDVSEGLHVSLKDAYRSTNWVNFTKQLLAYLDTDLGMSMMRLNLTYLALNGFYVPDSAQILDLLPPPIKLLNTWRVRRIRQLRNPDSPR